MRHGGYILNRPAGPAGFTLASSPQLRKAVAEWHQVSCQCRTCLLCSQATDIGNTTLHGLLSHIATFTVKPL